MNNMKLLTPDPCVAVGNGYADFRQVDDAGIVTLLGAHRDAALGTG